MFRRFRRYLTALAIGDVLLTIAALALAVISVPHYDSRKTVHAESIT